MHMATTVCCPLDKYLSSLCTSLYCNWASEIKTKAVMGDLVGCLIIALQLVQHVEPVASQACVESLTNHAWKMTESARRRSC